MCCVSQSTLHLSTLRALQKSLTRQVTDIGKICNSNKYALEYLISAGKQDKSLLEKQQEEEVAVVSKRAELPTNVLGSDEDEDSDSDAAMEAVGRGAEEEVGEMEGGEAPAPTKPKRKKGSKASWSSTAVANVHSKDEGKGKGKGKARRKKKKGQENQ